MLETNFTIRFIRIVSSHIEIARKLPKTFELQIECKAKIKTPKNAEEKKAALFFVLNIGTLEKEDIKINLEADILLEFSHVTEDYSKLIEDKCMPRVQIELFNLLDEILVKMGHENLCLAENSSNG